METVGGTMTRGEVSRWLARVELVIAGLLVLVIQPVVLISAPASIGPVVAADDWPSAVSLVGAAMQLAALGLMVRWYRAAYPS